jgi:Protein of unknown function (DUF4232)
MKKINLINRFLAVNIIWAFFSTGILLISAANSVMPKLSGSSKTNIESINPHFTISSKLSSCQTKQLSLSRVSVAGGMGHGGAIYVFSNTSSSDCTLNGYPKLVLLTANNYPLIGVKIKLSQNNYFHHSQQQQVSLKPKDRASFMVAHTHINRSGKNCRFSAKVEITPPGADYHFTIAEKLRSCDSISITPIEAGTIEH